MTDASGPGGEDVQLVLDGLDALMVHGAPHQQRRAYDLLLRLGAGMGSDGRWRDRGRLPVRLVPD